MNYEDSINAVALILKSLGIIVGNRNAIPSRNSSWVKGILICINLNLNMIVRKPIGKEQQSIKLATTLVEISLSVIICKHGGHTRFTHFCTKKRQNKQTRQSEFIAITNTSGKKLEMDIRGTTASDNNYTNKE